jgi:zinc protease
VVGRRTPVSVGIFLLMSLCGTIAAADDKASAAIKALETKAAVAADAGAIKMMTGLLPTDPRLVTGTLDNGIRYIVVRHANPPGRAAVWLNVSSGSLNETDKQRGIAHYLEHMAFNGSTNFPPGTVVPLFESLGMTFGRHQNAFTSYDQTAYQLSLPDCSPEKIEKAMQFMSDVAFRLNLDPAEIDAERQIILEEKRARQSPDQRVFERTMQQLDPGSLITNRMPIGTEETILGVAQQDFKDYYGTFYTAGNMTVIAVADADPAVLIGKIKEHFSAGPKAPPAPDTDPRLTPFVAQRGFVITDAELTESSVSLTRTRKFDGPVTTHEAYRARLVENIATAAFDRRMSNKIDEGRIACLSAGAQIGGFANAAKIASIDVTGESNAWRQLLTTLGAETQRARLHGFTQRELDDVTKDFIAGAERAVSTESTIPADSMLRRMNQSVASGEPIMSAQQRLDLLKGLLPTITRADINACFAENFDPANAAIVLTAPTTANAPSNEEFLSLAREALAARPEADIERARASAFMDTLPTPGSLSEATTHGASAVTSAWLSNGVRVHYKFMDIRKDSVSVQITLAGGVVQEDAATRGLTEAATTAFAQTATAALSSTDVKDLMTGKKISVGGGGGMMRGGSADTVSLTISGSPSDLETGFQLAHLLLTQPKLEESALQQWKQQQEQFITMRSNQPMGAFAEVVVSNAYPKEDARTQLLTKEQVRAVTLPAAQAWLDKLVRTAPMEVSIVGDLPKERAMELVTTYLASLPQRERVASSTLQQLRTLQRPAGPMRVDSQIATQTKQAMVMSGFYGADASNIDDTRALQMAARTLSSRMIKVLREEEQLVYSIGASSRPATDWPGFGMFAAQSTTEAAKVPALAAKIESMYAEFAKSGPTPEELDVAKKQMANEMDDTMKRPEFWSQRLSDIAYRGRSLDDVMAAPAAYQAMSAETVREVFAKYYTPASSMTFTITPKE